MLYSDPITKTITDDDGDLLCVAITAEWPGGQRESVYLSRDGGEQVTSGLFGTRYTSAANTRTPVTSPAAGFAYSFLRDGYWPASVVTVRTVAVDASGGITTDEASYSVALPVPAASPAASASSDVVVYRALKIDPVTGDLVHNGRNLELVSGIQAVAQALRTRLAFFQGEWFLDESFGVPYFQTILGKQVPLLAVREVFRVIITETVGVKSIKSLELRETSPRHYVLSFTVDTDLDEFLTLTVPTAGV